MNSGAKRVRAFGRDHAKDLKFLAWARTANVTALRAKMAQLIRQRDFPTWKRVVIQRALMRELDLEEKLNS